MEAAAAIIALLMQVITLLPALIQAGIEIQGLIKRVQDAVGSGSMDPTDAMWQAVNAEIDALRTQLNTDPPQAA